MSKWKAFFGLCWCFGHDHQQVVDCEERRAFQKCSRCGNEFQYDFQAWLPPEWIGFCDPDHTCPLCFGWKPKAYDRCANEICSINPDGLLKFHPDGTLRPDLDGR